MSAHAFNTTRHRIAEWGSVYDEARGFAQAAARFERATCLYYSGDRPDRHVENELLELSRALVRRSVALSDEVLGAYVGAHGEK